MRQSRLKSTSSILALLVPLALAPAAQVVRRPPVLAGYFEVELTYDDNLFRYSPEDLVAFRQSTDPARFPIRSSDDLDVVVATGWSFRFRLAGRRGDATLRAKLHQYASDWDKSYSLVETGIRQRVIDRGTAGVSFLWMPNYLIRYYRNPDSKQKDYVGCRFSEYLVTAEYEQRLGRFSFVPRYRFESDDYLQAFDFYDTKAHRFGGVFGFQPAAGFKLEAEYERKLARAAGPSPDISYNQNELSLMLHARPERARFDFEAGYGVQFRSYTTTSLGDLAHAGRKDDIENLGLEAGYRLGRARISLRYELEWRNVRSPYIEAIQDIKQYRQNRLGLGVRVNPENLLSRSGR